MNDLEVIKQRLESLEKDNKRIMNLLEELAKRKPTNDVYYNVERLEISTGGGCNIYVTDEMKKKLRKPLDRDDLI